MNLQQINTLLLGCLVGISGFIAIQVFQLSGDVKVAQAKIGTLETSYAQLSRDFYSRPHQ